MGLKVCVCGGGGGGGGTNIPLPPNKKVDVKTVDVFNFKMYYTVIRF